MAGDDPYAAAKANLRDNVKTLFMIFGGIAGVVMAGTPFSGYGSLTPWTVHWWIASASLLLTITLIGVALYLLLRVLQSNLFYMDMLHDEFVSLSNDKSEQRELEELRGHFRTHKHLLLSDDVKSIEELSARADASWKKYMDFNLQVDKDVYQVHHETLEKISYWAAFELMRIRTNTGTNKVLLIGLMTLACTVAFSLSVGAPKPSLEVKAQTSSSPKIFAMATTMDGRLLSIELLSFDINMIVSSSTKPIIAASTLGLLNYQSVNRVLILGFRPLSDKSMVSKAQVRRKTKKARQEPVRNKKATAPVVPVVTYLPTVIPYKIMGASGGKIIFIPLILKP